MLRKKVLALTGLLFRLPRRYSADPAPINGSLGNGPSA
jgi:hypothetical protein